MSVYADVIRYRELFGSLFRRDLSAKYRGSFLGLGWSLLHPLVLMLVYLLVFSVLWRVAEVGSDDYWLFLLCGLPAWVFFATASQAASRSLLENANLIRKVRFPRQLVPLSIVGTNLVSFAVMLGLVIGAEPLADPGGPRHRLARDPARRAVRVHRRGVRPRRRVAERALPRRRAPAAGAPPAVVLPHADPVQPRRSSRRRRLPGRRLLPALGELPHAPDRGDARRCCSTATLRASEDTIYTVVAAAACARVRRLRVQPLGRPDRDRSLTTARPSNSRSGRRRPGALRAREARAPRRSDGRRRAPSNRGLRPPPGAQAASPPVAARSARSPVPPPRSPPRGRRAGGVTSPGAGTAPGTRWATATASSDTSGSSCAASAASSSGRLAVHADRESPLADARVHLDGEVERRGSELGEPEAELLHEVERQAIRAGRSRRDDRRLELDRLARTNDVRERRRGSRPRRSRCQADRASGTRAGRLRGRASATVPCRRSRVARALAWPLPARCSSSSYASHRTASGPAGTGCSPTRSIAAAYSRSALDRNPRVDPDPNP